MDPFDRAYFEAICRSAAQAIRAAANPEVYDINPIGLAVYKATGAMREARRLRLIPTTDQLAREYDDSREPIEDGEDFRGTEAREAARTAQIDCYLEVK